MKRFFSHVMSNLGLGLLIDYLTTVLHKQNYQRRYRPTLLVHAFLTATSRVGHIAYEAIQVYSTRKREPAVNYSKLLLPLSNSTIIRANSTKLWSPIHNLLTSKIFAKRRRYIQLHVWERSSALRAGTPNFAYFVALLQASIGLYSNRWMDIRKFYVDIRRIAYKSWFNMFSLRTSRFNILFCNML